MRDAQRFANSNFEKEEKNEIFLNFAEDFFTNQQFNKAEQIYIIMGEPERAIKMYKKIENWDKMLELFAKNRPDSLKNAHILIGKKQEEKENL